MSYLLQSLSAELADLRRRLPGFRLHAWVYDHDQVRVDIIDLARQLLFPWKLTPGELREEICRRVVVNAVTPDD